MLHLNRIPILFTVSITLYLVFPISAFITPQSSFVRRNHSFKRQSRQLRIQKDDNSKAINIPNPLPSIFPKEGIPAGLRGEAVRTSLRDPNKGLWFELTDPSTFNAGVFRVGGPGTLPFLHSKFTGSFDKLSLAPFLQTLEGSSSSSPLRKKGLSKVTCYLTAKGRAVDTPSVLLTCDLDSFGDGSDPTSEIQYQSFILTSPFHGSGLYEKLSPYVFPLDGIELLDCTSTMSAFCVVSTTLKKSQSILQKSIVSALQIKFPSSSPFEIPDDGESYIWGLDNEKSNTIYIMEGGTMLPPACARGYTILVPKSLSPFIKECFTGDTDGDADNLPTEISALEWDGLRIESGNPAYGREMTGDVDTQGFKANPLELHLQSYVDLEKGCYQGQEGVSSVVKNKRGPPRTLYSVVFDDEENAFDEENEEEDDIEMVRQPMVGDELFVLGSNESIQAGVITSVAEPGSTGKPNTIALGLLRRPDSILKKMKDMNLDFGAGNVEDDLFFLLDEEEKEQKMEEIRNTPPPIDPLDGLEVIIKGTYTAGKVTVIAQRAAPKGKNIFDDEVMEESEVNGAVMGYVDTNVESTVPIEESPSEQVSEDLDEEELAQAIEEANKAAAEAEKAAAEAKRKAEKMELLRQRAEAAMAKRKKKKETQ